jgi:hypothetical protein
MRNTSVTAPTIDATLDFPHPERSRRKQGGHATLPVTS